MKSGTVNLSAVIFDFGCVLTLTPELEDFEPLRAAIGVDRDLMQKMYWSRRDDYDADAVDNLTYWHSAARVGGLNFSPEKIQQLSALDAAMWNRPNHVMVEWAKVLRGHGLKTAMLSNMPRAVATALRQQAKWFGHIDHLTLSGELKLAKPGLEIYRVCLQGIGVAAESALFIDDRDENIAAARELGMHGIVFRSVEELAPELEPYGLADSLAEAQCRVKGAA